MIDIHTHILPGIDDGAADWQESLMLARAAVKEGITDLIATPHHANGRYDNKADDVQRLVAVLQQRLHEERIPLRVYAGQEVRVHIGMLQAWEKQQLLSLAGSNYLLLEMPASSIPEHMTDYIYELKLLGVQVIIAHPERNAEVVRHPDRIRRLIEEGAYAQVTTHSLLGGFGKTIEKMAWQLCQEGCIHLISSDAHHLERRGFRLNEAYASVRAKLGDEALQVFQHNSKVIIEGGQIRSFVGKNTSYQNILKKILKFGRSN